MNATTLAAILKAAIETERWIKAAKGQAHQTKMALQKCSYIQHLARLEMDAAEHNRKYVVVITPYPAHYTKHPDPYVIEDEASEHERGWKLFASVKEAETYARDGSNVPGHSLESVFRVMSVEEAETKHWAKPTFNIPEKERMKWKII